MRFTGEQEWYTKESRRPALIRRSTLLSLHAIVKAKEPDFQVKSSHHRTYKTTNNKSHLTIPISFQPKPACPVGTVFANLGPVSDVESELIQTTYCVVQINGSNFGAEIIDDQLALICLGPITREPFAVKDFLIVRENDIENYPEGPAFVTTYGRYIVNYFLLAAPICKRKFFKELKFINDTWPFGKIEKVLAQLIHSGALDVDMVDKYIDYGYFLSSIGEICGTTMTRKSIVPSQEVIDLRDKLLEKYKDQLRDPRIMTIIENECIAADRAYMAGDPSMDFLGDSAKKFNVHRKRKNLAVGLVEEFGGARGNYNFIKGSLSDGWQPEDIPALFDESRRGFFDRAKETEVAGMDTKAMIAVFQNCQISNFDCGTKDLLTVTLTKETASTYIGSHVKTGETLKTIPISFPQNEIEELKGKRAIYTTRIKEDYEKYHEKDLVKTPWGDTYMVVQRFDYLDVDSHAFVTELSEAQKEAIRGKEYCVLKLYKYAIIPGFTPITADNVDAFIGRPIEIRSFMGCTPKDGRYCMICAGKRFELMDYKNASAQFIDVGAVMLTMSMKSMHGTKIDTFTIDSLDDYVLNP